MRLATVRDLRIVTGLFDEASRWEASQGFVHPFPVPFPPEQVRPSIEREELYLVVTRSGDPIGTVVLQWDDVPFWGVRPPDAAYVHRLTVRRAFAGRGIGRWMIEWAAAQAKEQRRGVLRLDCLTSSVGLHRYYQSLGFKRVGEVSRGGFDCTLFERRLS